MKVRNLLFTLLGFGLIGSPVLAERFQTAPDNSGNSLTFRLSAPLETIVGTSAGVSGHFSFDPNDVRASSDASFVVDVASFDTGIDMRDEHFRDNFLHTGEYPSAVFTLDRILKSSKKKLKPGESAELEAEGTFDLHGVKRTERVKGVVTYIEGSDATKGVLPGNILALDASFRIKLADYNIERPQMLVLKVGEEVDINVVSRLTDAPHLLASSGKCSACGGKCNPCGAGKCNPCGDAKCNPCGGAKCNPCGGAKCNPCGAGKANPCGI